MPLYLSKFGYTPETWAKLVANPEDRRTAARSYIESVGGRLHGFWYAFGAHDGYTLSSLETTVLLTVDETLEALRKVEEVRYRPPGS